MEAIKTTVNYGTPAVQKPVQPVIQTNQNPPIQEIRVNHLGSGGGGKAIASLIPGLGQLCDGRTLAGLGYMVAVPTSIAAGFAAKNMDKIIHNMNYKAAMKEWTKYYMENKKEFPDYMKEAIKENPLKQLDSCPILKRILKINGNILKYSVGAFAVLAPVIYLANFIDAYKGGLFKSADKK